MKLSFSIKGADRVARKFRALEKLAKKDQKKCIRKGARAGAKIIQKQAKQNAPKDKGELRKSIKVRSLKRSRRWVGARVVTDVRHAWPVEAGTEKVEAKKYMEKAQTSKKEQAKKVFEDTILTEIKKIWEGK